MGNFPDILRKPAIIPVRDIDEMFPSVYLTFHGAPWWESCGEDLSAGGGDPADSSAGAGLLGGEMDRLCLFTASLMYLFFC